MIEQGLKSCNPNLGLPFVQVGNNCREHMLFYASEKCPLENSYSKYFTEPSKFPCGTEYLREDDLGGHLERAFFMSLFDDVIYVYTHYSGTYIEDKRDEDLLVLPTEAAIFFKIHRSRYMLRNIPKTKKHSSRIMVKLMLMSATGEPN